MELFNLLFILKLFSVMFYFFLASQGGFYLLAFAKVLYLLPTDRFLEIRKVIDKVIEAPLKILYPTSLICMLCWLLIAGSDGGGYESPFLLLSFALLAVDLTIAFKVSIPLNTLIEMLNDASDGVPGEAVGVQQRWLKFIVIRAYFSVGGFAMLILHLFLKI